MNYELFSNGQSLIKLDLTDIGLVALLVATIAFLFIYYVWYKLREGESMRYEFITIIAHKFRTPLTIAKWLLEELIPIESDAHKRENLNDIKKSNQKLITLTGTLIELTNLNSETKTLYDFKPIKLSEFVKSVAEAQKGLFHEKNIFFSVQCTDTESTINIDRSRMDFVIETVLENACNYTSPGHNVDLIAFRNGHKAVIGVVDKGIGIEPQDLSKIFTKFFRAPNARAVDTEGFGVGLYLAQSIVKRHHGKISVKSGGKDQGSTFTIELPAKKHSK